MSDIFSPSTIARFRAETDGVQHVNHLNNAGAALTPNKVRDRVLDYLKEEALQGGYESAAKHHEELQASYEHIAQFINAKSSEIALLENATVAWNMAFSSIPFKAGDIILTTEVEYGSNFINYLKAKKEKGVVLQIIPEDEQGNIDLLALEKMIHDRVRLISVTHMPTSGGIVNPAKEIGELAAKHGILYLLDSCQSIGQLPMDVQQLKCSFLTATGRKFLRAPRGTGFLYVNANIIDQLSPPFLDQHAAVWQKEDQYQMHPGAQRFENWENNKALQLGLSSAVQYAQEIGMENIWKQIQYLANYCRAALSELKQVEILDRGKHLGGIVTFRHQKMAPFELQALLLESKINTSVSVQRSTLLDLKKRNIETLNRASIHYYNTTSEVDQLIQVLQKV